MSVAERLEGARRREKEQTLFYRALAAAAEDAGWVAEAERFNDLHADEQHHLSRLTARVLELGGSPEDLRRLAAPAVPSLAAWEPAARAREDDEVRFYEALITVELDASTRAVLEEILEAERRHREHLGGKWMSA
jgi:rubrerythrin